MEEKKEIKIDFSNKFEIHFSDLVKIEGNPETVSLTFCIRSHDNLTATATHKVIMTLPHYLRLVETCNKTAKEMLGKIEKAKKEQK